MAITRVGFIGPMTAYAAFSPKTEAAVILTMQVAQSQDRGSVVSGAVSLGASVSDAESS